MTAKGEEKGFRTVRDVADEMGVSVASVAAKLKKNGLKKKNGRYRVDEETYLWLQYRKGKSGRPWNRDIYKEAGGGI